jgi:hypothetical protein
MMLLPAASRVFAHPLAGETERRRGLEVFRADADDRMRVFLGDAPVNCKARAAWMSAKFRCACVC